MKISGELKGEIDVKRFCLEGLDISYICPLCSQKIQDTNYISYPDMNKLFDFDCYCYQCDHSWTEKVILKVTLFALEDEK